MTRLSHPLSIDLWLEAQKCCQNGRALPLFSQNNPWALGGVTLLFCGLGYVIADQLEKVQSNYAYTPERLEEIESRARVNASAQRQRNANITSMIQDMKEGRGQKYDDKYWKVLGYKEPPGEKKS